MTEVLIKSFGTYLKGPSDKNFLFYLFLRPKGPSVPLELIYRAQEPISFSETYFKGPKAQIILRNLFIGHTGQ